MTVGVRAAGPPEGGGPQQRGGEAARPKPPRLGDGVAHEARRRAWRRRATRGIGKQCCAATAAREEVAGAHPVAGGQPLCFHYEWLAFDGGGVYCSSCSSKRQSARDACVCEHAVADVSEAQDD